MNFEAILTVFLLFLVFLTIFLAMYYFLFIRPTLKLEETKKERDRNYLYLRVNAIRSMTNFIADDIYLNPISRSGISIDCMNSKILLIEDYPDKNIEPRQSMSGDATEDDTPMYPAFNISPYKIENIIEPHQLLSVEMIADNESLVYISRGNLGGLIGGSVLAGGVGAVMEGLSGLRTLPGRVKKLKLKIVTDRTDNPVHEIPFFHASSPEGVLRTNRIYKQAMENAIVWHSRLSTIIKQSESDRFPKDPISQKEPLSINQADYVI